MSLLFSLPATTALDTSGAPLMGARLYFYQSGTTTPKNVYQDSGLVTAHSNPVVSDASGVFPAIWLDVSAGAYRVTLTDVGGSLRWSYDGIDTEVIVPASPTQVVYPAIAAETMLGITPSYTSYPVGDTRRYGAVIDGVTNDSAAIANAIAVIRQTGGVLFFAPGVYFVTSQIVFSGNIQKNIIVSGFGATIRSSSAVTGAAWRQTLHYTPHQIVIEGLTFDHGNNTTVGAAIEVRGTAKLTLRNITVIQYNTKSTWAAIKLTATTPGDYDSHSFWTLIDGLTIRMYTGGMGTNGAVGVLFEGAANATTIRNSSFEALTIGIKLGTDGAVTGLANGVVIDGCWFETIGTALWVIANPAPALWPTGLRFINNRIESAAYVAQFTTTTGAAADPHSHPPLFLNNYASVGSITSAYINNPTNAFLQRGDLSLYGDAGDVIQMASGGLRYRVIGNVAFGNHSDNSAWNGGHLVMGTYHLWVDTGTGKLRFKDGAPASAADGFEIAFV